MEIIDMNLTEFLYEKRNDFYDYLQLADAIKVSNRRKGRDDFYIVSKSKIDELKQFESIKKQMEGTTHE